MSYVQQNPILIDTVLRQLFLFTDYETLKVCRLVCHKWKDLCDRIFFRKTAFVVKHYPLIIPDEESENEIIVRDSVESAIEMQSIFESVNQDILFTATFKFEMDLLSPNIKIFYLEPNKALMTSLELYMTNYCLMGKNDFDDLIGPNLKTLKVYNTNDGFHIPLSLDKLVAISEEIDLECCDIKKNCDQRISTKNLGLKIFNIILDDDELVTNPQMNDIVDFSTIDDLYFSVANDDPDDTTERSLPIVNLSDCRKIKKVNLFSLTVNLDAQISPLGLKLGFNNYTRNGRDVEEIQLRDFFCSSHFDWLAINKDKQGIVKVNFNDDLSIKELQIGVANFPVYSSVGAQGLPSNTIDLSLLPKSIEILSFDESKNNGTTLAGTISLPNLKHLSLNATSGDENCESAALPFFKDCPLLEDVTLACIVLNTDHLPVNTKRLAFKFINKVEGSKICKLDVLAVYSCELAPFPEMFAILENKLLKKFKADLFVFTAEGEEHLCEENVSFLMEIKNKLNLGNMAFGPVTDICDQLRQKFALPECIDNYDNYYFVEGKNGKKITKTEFEDLLQWV